MTTRTRVLALLLLGALLGLGARPGHAQAPTAPYQYPFQDPARPAEERITNLISLMTLDEKIACLATRTSVPRLGIAGTNHAEGLHGLSLAGPRVGQAQPGGPPVAPRPAPPGAVGAAGGGVGRPRQAPLTTTTFPQAIGMAETWDPEAVRKMGAAEGNEARYISQSAKYGRPVLIVMAPNSDLGRDPRWGRTEECYGEDAYFNGTLVSAMVRGLQGDDPHYWQTSALLKHFLANSNENDRDKTSSDFDDRLLREYYSVPFRMGIEAGARGYMAAYNSHNGIPMGVSPLLEDMTVKEWGNDGIICTDGGAMGQLVTSHHYYADLPHAVAGTLHAGITKYLERAGPAVMQALDQHLISEADIDKAIRPNFRILLHLGLLDPPARVPYTKIGTDGEPEPWLSPAHKSLARAVTRESIVLLKNGGLLPLNKSVLKSIAVIGPRADRVLLDWYGGAPPYVVTPLAGIRAKVGPGVTVRYADGSDTAEAARLARTSDVAIVCVGNHPTGGDNQGWDKVNSPDEGREAVDRQSISLEPGQEELVKQVYAANPRTVVALISSFPYAINWTQAHVLAIVHMTQCSQETGNALADVLFGDYNPGGRLVQTWPASLDQLPPMMDYDIRNGRTYQYFQGKPLYPFGYGLSYTTFAYSHLKTSAASLGADAPMQVSVDVTNTGSRAGDEVVQMYVTHLGSAVQRPLEQLAGFQRVTLKPGETRTVTLPLRAEQTAYWDIKAHRFVVENDWMQIRVGRSAEDIKLRKTVPVTL